ncbi:MAG TPA: MMPL family transporter, partial [Thermomicrobiales bacterium]|nr:MMPL family transporter [Thermomicrobiales bacterium]
FEAEQGVNDPAVKQAMEALFATVSAEVTDAQVNSPYAPGGERQISPDGTIAFAEVNFTDRSQEEYREAGDQIREHAEEIDVSGLQIEFGGNMFIEQADFSSELIGILCAVVILLIAFGSLLAMGLPIMTALFGIGCGIALIGLAANVLSVPVFASPAAAMIGIGVGIDYALFIVTRYRQGLHDGMEPEAAVVRALDTAGRAVLFAGITVVISLMGMFLINLDAMRGLAISASLAVLMTMLAAVTLLPAVLGFAGRKIDKFGLPHRKQAEGDTRQSIWFRWSRVIQRRPWAAAVIGIVALLILIVPVFSMRLGFGDAGNRPESDTTRQAYDLLSRGFGPGSNGPLLLAVELPNGQQDLPALQGLVDTLNQTDGVAFASPPIPNEAGDTAIVQVIPTTSPQDEATSDLVHHLRDDVIPPVNQANDLDILVGGAPAAVIDFSDYTAGVLPLFVGAVLILSFLLLMAVFRSLVVPLKAVLVNLLSIGAAMGVIVAVFQWGWGLSLIGLGKEGPVEAWAPLMIFAIVFGLSMDYEVFLLSRIREEYDRTHDNATAVADGLAATARVITAAAAIMVCVFGSFVLGSDPALKIMGLGLAVAVLLDATIVRLVIVPALMELLGDRNWWIPGWLDRLLPALNVEPTDEPTTTGERRHDQIPVTGE